MFIRINSDTWNNQRKIFENRSWPRRLNTILEDVLKRTLICQRHSSDIFNAYLGKTPRYTFSNINF